MTHAEAAAIEREAEALLGAFVEYRKTESADIEVVLAMLGLPVTTNTKNVIKAFRRGLLNVGFSDGYAAGIAVREGQLDETTS